MPISNQTAIPIVNQSSQPNPNQVTKSTIHHTFRRRVIVKPLIILIQVSEPTFSMGHQSKHQRSSNPDRLIVFSLIHHQQQQPAHSPATGHKNAAKFLSNITKSLAQKNHNHHTKVRTSVGQVSHVNRSNQSCCQVTQPRQSGTSQIVRQYLKSAASSCQ